MNPDVVKAVGATAELTGTELSAAALRVMVSDLSEYPVPAVMKALVRCRKELSGRLTLSAIIERIEDDDGRPSANEAWGTALASFDEEATVVTNDEIGEAMAAARPIMDKGDEIGARMAFRDAYDRIVRRNREAGIVRPVWYPSLGTDTTRRVDAIKAAEDRGLLTSKQVASYLPAPMTDDDRARGAVIAGLLTGESAPMPDDKDFRKNISNLLYILKASKQSEAA